MFGSANVDLDFIDRTPRRGRNKDGMHHRPSRIANTEKEVLKHRNSTVVTPVVGHIASNLFKRSLVIAGSPTFDDVDDHVAAEIDNVRAHHSDPKSMRWGDSAEGVPGYYSSVTMDGVTYQVRTFSGSLSDPKVLITLSGWRGCDG